MVRQSRDLFSWLLTKTFDGEGKGLLLIYLREKNSKTRVVLNLKAQKTELLEKTAISSSYRFCLSIAVAAVLLC